MERFYSKVNKNALNGCHEWTASTNKGGYGQFKWFDHGNGKQKVIEAHRVAWFLKKGVWPTYLCHTCDNSKCVNLDHLYEGNNTLNIRDKVERHKGWTVKHSNHLIRRIRRIYALGISSTHIAKALKIPRGTVLNIINGHTHKKTGGPIRNTSRRTYGNRFQNSELQNSRSAARFLTSVQISEA